MSIPVTLLDRNLVLILFFVKAVQINYARDSVPVCEILKKNENNLGVGFLFRLASPKIAGKKPHPLGVFAAIPCIPFPLSKSAFLDMWVKGFS